jgi:hypothetical protein
MASEGLHIDDSGCQLTRPDGSRIPPSIRQHLSEFQSARFTRANERLHLFGEPKISSSSTQHQTSEHSVPGSERQASPGLLHMPDEMLVMIINKLDPADVVCLALTCPQLDTKVDYTLHDLRALENASDSSIVYINQQFSSVVRSQRFLITERLDRDRLRHLASLNQDSAGMQSLRQNSQASLLLHHRAYEATGRWILFGSSIQTYRK